MPNKLTEFFKKRTKTIKFGKEKKDDYDAKFERAKVQATTTMDNAKTEPLAFLKDLSVDELKVRLDTAIGEEKDRIKEILKTKTDKK